MSSNRRDFLKGSVAAAAIGGLGSIADDGRAAESPGDELVFQRRITVRHEVDVFVAGGGPAGVAAAVAAARQGARVFLAERNTCLGGMGTAGMLPLFMQFTDGVHMLAGGIGDDIQRRLKENGGTGPGSDVTIRAEVLKRVYDELLVEATVTGDREKVMQCMVLDPYVRSIKQARDITSAFLNCYREELPQFWK